jgi:hypothetical protein
MAEDRDLARLFEELRRADEASAPSFDNVLERQGVGPRTPARVAPLRFAALVVLLVAVALAAVLIRRPAGEKAGLELPRTLAQWKSPTDSLLRTPGSEFLSELPTLSGSVPKYAGFEGAEMLRGETPRPPALRTKK